MSRSVTRREFLVGTTLVVASCSSNGDSDGGLEGSDSTLAESASVTPNSLESAAPSESSDLFRWGVASGDPETDSVMLWTRVWVGEGSVNPTDMNLSLEVATDAEFQDLVAVTDVTADAAFGHSVHALVTELQPATTYFYRFYNEEGTGPVGRTKTLPDGSPESFKVAHTTCQDPQSGLYQAWDSIAEANIDAVIFTGDYIYELPPIPAEGDRTGERIWPNDPPVDVDGFRARYEFVKSDPALQAAHAMHPFFMMWDDHEVSDNYWSDGPGQFNIAGGDFDDRRTNAYMVWWEFQPVRFDPPTTDRLDIHRTVKIGDLVDFILLDCRQHADEPPCRDTSTLDNGELCEEAAGDDHSILGLDQRAWALEEIAASSASWTAMVSSVIFSGIIGSYADDDPSGEPLYYLESWDGYPSERKMIADALREKDHAVVLSGDFHASIVLDVGPGFGEEKFATEFVCPAISSGSSDDPTEMELNPHVQMFDIQTGYTVCEFTADGVEATYMNVSDRWDPDADVVEAGVFQA